MKYVLLHTNEHGTDSHLFSYQPTRKRPFPDTKLVAKHFEVDFEPEKDEYLEIITLNEKPEKLGKKFGSKHPSEKLGWGDDSWDEDDDDDDAEAEDTLADAKLPPANTGDEDFQRAYFRRLHDDVSLPPDLFGGLHQRVLFRSLTDDYRTFDNLMEGLNTNASTVTSHEELRRALEDLARADCIEVAWPIELDKSHGRENDVLVNQLLLWDDIVVPIETIAAWSDDEFWEAAVYLAASLYRANDNPVYVPPKPRVLKELKKHDASQSESTATD
jgi:hypothetical protein